MAKVDENEIELDENDAEFNFSDDDDDDVLILAQQGSSLFGKEVLYTAVTRARNSFFNDIRDYVLQQLINRSSRKISGLHARLRIAKESVCYQGS